MRLGLEDQALQRLPRGVPGEQYARRTVCRIFFGAVEGARSNSEIGRWEDLHLEACGLAAVIVHFLIPPVCHKSEHTDSRIHDEAGHQARELDGTSILERERRCGNEIEGLVVALEADRRVEASE